MRTAISTSLAVIAAALIAWLLVFWAPWFGGGYSYDYSYNYAAPDKDGFTDGTWSSSGFGDPGRLNAQVRELAKLQPKEFQQTVEAIFFDLVKLSEAQLSVLNAAEDEVCLSTLFDCLGVPPKNIKPFVAKALTYKLSRETAGIASAGVFTAQLSLAVAFAAFLVGLTGLVVATLTFLRKERA